ncbi:LOW QUALITY PROTEIN: reversion-inducing cysteine-rich protein with Kazal motifs [Palaemon carinicauda]|uniref:LOW QUALITY PROTEIN: reversion-inducing cysteine-rich protein with Kazal motifs n=1 Tax=Palaemon carinicauda TaxID=392227 RepID=UPI0035B5CC25
MVSDGGIQSRTERHHERRQEGMITHGVIASFDNCSDEWPGRCSGGYQGRDSEGLASCCPWRRDWHPWGQAWCPWMVKTAVLFVMLLGTVMEVSSQADGDYYILSGIFCLSESLRDCYFMLSEIFCLSENVRDCHSMLSGIFCLSESVRDCHSMLSGIFCLSESVRDCHSMLSGIFCLSESVRDCHSMLSGIFCLSESVRDCHSMLSGIFCLSESVRDCHSMLSGILCLSESVRDCHSMLSGIFCLFENIGLFDPNSPKAAFFDVDQRRRRSSCEAVFSARTPSRRLRHRLTKDCRAHAHVTRCAHALIRTTPAHRPERNLHCCAASDLATCRAVCRTVLTSDSPQQDILDQLEDACGTVDLTVGVWKCLFRHSEGVAPEVRPVSKLGRLGLDAAKLGCCSRAVSAECRGLCSRAFSKEWGRAWDALQTSCLTRPQEASLFACLWEADAPCQQGCSGLSFCTNFNHRPNELFRSCNARADAAAEEDLNLWQESRTLTLPGLAASVPLRSVSECQLELWKAVACSLHLRPCHATSLTNAICWHDCVKLLSRCVEDPGSSEGGGTAASVCGTLSPPPGSPCVSLASFLSPSLVPNEPPWRVPTSPCRPSPCPGRSVCTVNSECRAAEPCRPYVCTPACTLGEVSNVAVPVGAFVSVPFSSSGLERCGRVCECGNKGELESCRYLPCVDPAPCWLGTTKFDHDTEVVVGCELCVCHAGELTCVPRPTCPQHLHRFLPVNTGLGSGLVSRSLQRSTASGELPCGCTDHWVPVCASNGRTYPSECLARCSGLEEGSWAAGDCGILDACAGVRCGRGEVCVSAPAICLTLPTTSCPQHICVPTSGACPAEASGPACDTHGKNYDSLCHLVRDSSSLAYLGRCRTRCHANGTVCGRDGRTWASECQAHAHYVAVDYQGPCRGVGVDGSSCPSVTCPAKLDSRCVGVESSGWCCGRVCGGGMAMAWSTRAIEVASVVLPHHRPLTVAALMASLASHVTVSECEVRGQLTLEGYLLVLVTPTASHSSTPPPLVAAACVVEAERLVGVVRARSPRLVASLPAAALTLAAPAHTSAAGGASYARRPMGVVLLVLLLLVPKCMEIALS